MWALLFNGVYACDILSKLICFGAYGVLMFQGFRNDVTKQICESWAPFFSNIHCMVHKTNLIVQTLSSLNIVDHLEVLLQGLHIFSP
jgi:hypothetical protein